MPKDPSAEFIPALEAIESDINVLEVTENKQRIALITRRLTTQLLRFLERPILEERFGLSEFELAAVKTGRLPLETRKRLQVFVQNQLRLNRS